MKIEALLALIRHGLTVAGGALVANGVASADDVSMFAGAVVTILGLGWSLYRKVTNAPRRA